MPQQQQQPHGWHTLGIECKGVLSTGVDRMLVGNWVGLGLTRSTINSFAPVNISQHGNRKNVLMVVSPLWRGLGILGLTDQAGYFSQVQQTRRCRHEDNNVAIAPVQPHYY